jgi:hypothetical protein
MFFRSFIPMWTIILCIWQPWEFSYRWPAALRQHASGFRPPGDWFPQWPAFCWRCCPERGGTLPGNAAAQSGKLDGA